MFVSGTTGITHASSCLMIKCVDVSVMHAIPDTDVQPAMFGCYIKDRIFMPAAKLG